MVMPSFALAMSLAGTKCEGTRATLDGSHTREIPSSRNRAMATGAVTSFPMARSTSHITISPGSTASTPAARARIFCVMVWGVAVMHEPPG